MCKLPHHFSQCWEPRRGQRGDVLSQGGGFGDTSGAQEATTRDFCLACRCGICIQVSPWPSPFLVPSMDTDTSAGARQQVCCGAAHLTSPIQHPITGRGLGVRGKGLGVRGKGLLLASPRETCWDLPSRGCPPGRQRHGAHGATKVITMKVTRGRCLRLLWSQTQEEKARHLSM